MYVHKVPNNFTYILTSTLHSWRYYNYYSSGWIRTATFQGTSSLLFQWDCLKLRHGVQNIHSCHTTTDEHIWGWLADADLWRLSQCVSFSSARPPLLLLCRTHASCSFSSVRAYICRSPVKASSRLQLSMTYILYCLARKLWKWSKRVLFWGGVRWKTGTHGSSSYNTSYFYSYASGEYVHSAIRCCSETNGTEESAPTKATITATFCLQYTTILPHWSLPVLSLLVHILHPFSC
jgi:hypothetical protein